MDLTGLRCPMGLAGSRNVHLDEEVGRDYPRNYYDFSVFCICYIRLFYWQGKLKITSKITIIFASLGISMILYEWYLEIPWLFVFKSVAIILAGILGGIGASRDNRRYLLISIIIGSVVVTLTVQFLEELQQIGKDRSAAERSEALLRNLNRILQPFDKIRVHYTVKAPLTHEKTTDYLSRLEEKATEFLQKDKNATNDLFSIVGWTNNRPSVLRLKPNSLVYPDEQIENIAFEAFKFITFELHFYKIPIDVKATPWLSVGANQPRTLIFR